MSKQITYSFEGYQPEKQKGYQPNTNTNSSTLNEPPKNGSLKPVSSNNNQSNSEEKKSI